MSLGFFLRRKDGNRSFQTASKDNIVGKVFVTALVGENGKVRQIGRITGPLIFHEVAKAAALQAEFIPAMKPVRVWISLPFTFSLKE